MKQNPSRSSRQSGSQLPVGRNTLWLGASILATAAGVIVFRNARSQQAEPSGSHATFLVKASPEQAYQLWRDFERLPSFMAHLKSVRVLDNNRSEWVALGPGNREVRWFAELTEEQTNERIAWRSSPGSDVKTSGAVTFRPDPHGRGTFVTAQVTYRLPGGTLASSMASIFGRHPDFTVREDLRRFKSLLEAGEVPTILGQTHGPRGMHGRAEQMLFREWTNMAEPQAAREYRKTA